MNIMEKLEEEKIKKYFIRVKRKKNIFSKKGQKIMIKKYLIEIIDMN